MRCSLSVIAIVKGKIRDYDWMSGFKLQTKSDRHLDLSTLENDFGWWDVGWMQTLVEDKEEETKSLFHNSIQILAEMCHTQ